MDNLELSKAKEAEIAALDAADAAANTPEPKVTEPEIPKEPEPPKEDKEEEPKERVERKVYTIPLDKHNKQLENAKKIKEEELAAIREQVRLEVQAQYKAPAPVAQPIEDVKSFAEKHGLDEDVVNGLVEVAERRIASKMPKVELPEGINEEIAAFKKQREISVAKQQFSSDFDSEVLPIIQKEYPHLTLDQLNSVKSKLDELAFSPRYNTYSLSDLYRVKSQEFDLKPAPSIESSRGGTSVSQDYSSYNAEQLQKMSPKEAEAYFKWEESQLKGSKYLN